MSHHFLPSAKTFKKFFVAVTIFSTLMWTVGPAGVPQALAAPSVDLSTIIESESINVEPQPGGPVVLYDINVADSTTKTIQSLYFSLLGQAGFDPATDLSPMDSELPGVFLYADGRVESGEGIPDAPGTNGDGVLNSVVFLSNPYQISRFTPISTGTYTIDGVSNTVIPALAAGDLIYHQKSGGGWRWSIVTADLTSSTFSINGSAMANGTYIISKFGGGAGNFITLNSDASGNPTDIVGGQNFAAGDIVYTTKSNGVGSFGIFNGTQVTGFSATNFWTSSQSYYVTKFNTAGYTPVGADATLTSGMNFEVGDIVYCDIAGSSGYGTHIVTTGEVVGVGSLPSTLRFDGSSSSVSFDTNTLLGKLSPTSTDDVLSTDQELNSGDLVYAGLLGTSPSVNTSYSWHLVTTGGTGGGDSALRLDSSGEGPWWPWYISVSGLNSNDAADIPLDNTTVGNVGADYFLGINLSETADVGEKIKGYFFTNTGFGFEGGTESVNFTNLPLLTSVVTVTELSDEEPPASPGLFDITGQTSSTISLRWTAPGDDGDASGTVSSYDLRYANTPFFTPEDWAAGTTVEVSGPFGESGQEETITVTDLDPSTDYYFGLVACDEVLNCSGTAYINGSTSAAGDETSPSQITDLTATDVTDSTISVSWTAPGDDGGVGTANTYDLRYSTSEITPESWGLATTVDGESAPQAAGSTEEYVITGLDPEITYYVAIKAVDEASNWSSLSNVVNTTTEAVPGDETPPAQPDNFTIADATTDTISLLWTAPGDDGAGGGSVTSYELRWSTSPITLENYNGATSVTIDSGLVGPGETQTYDFTGATADTHYYFALTASDEIPNFSWPYVAVDGVTLAEEGGADETPPGNISDLNSIETTSSTITLQWTEPGDDGAGGGAVEHYEMRYRTDHSILGPEDWAGATQVTDLPSPIAAGGTLSKQVTGLSPETTYYFFILAFDNDEGLSQGMGAATGTTLAEEGPSDEIPPTLLTETSNPQDGDSGVPIETFITMMFSEAISIESLFENIDFEKLVGVSWESQNFGINPYYMGFDLIPSAPPAFVPDSKFATLPITAKAFFPIMGPGTEIEPRNGTYTEPVLGDIVYFQREDFPAEVGIVTNATLTGGTFAINGFSLWGGQNLMKFDTGAEKTTGLTTNGALSVSRGDLMVAFTQSNPSSPTYNWHVVTSEGSLAINSGNLRIDGSASAPVFNASSRFSSFTPDGTAVDNGATVGGTLSVEEGDLVFTKTGAGAYGWHIVTEGTSLSSNIGENNAILDGDEELMVAEGSVMSKITPDAHSTVGNELDATEFSFGDMMYANTISGASSNGAYALHMVSGGATGITSSDLRLDNARSPLEPNSTYRITVGGGVTDVASNPMGEDEQITFSTSSVGSTDTTRPFIESTVPFNGNQNFPVDGRLRARFSVPMNSDGEMGEEYEGSVLNPENVGLALMQYGGIGDEVATSITYNSGTREIEVVPTSNLTAGTEYTLWISGDVESANGASMENLYRLNFRTNNVGGGSDTTAPRVLGSLPSNGSIDILRSINSICAGFSEDVDESTIDSESFYLTPSVSGSVAYYPSMRGACFIPDELLEDSTVYTLTVATSITDLVGNPLDQVADPGNQSFTSSFTTGAEADETSPQIISANADNFNVVVTFSKSMKTGGGTNAVDNITNYSLESPEGVTVSLAGKTVTYNGNTMTAQISGLALQNGNNFKLTVNTRVQDLWGNAISSEGTPPANVVYGMVLDANNTGGQLGPGSGQMQNSATQGMRPVRVTPQNRAMGAVSGYVVELPTDTSIPTGGSIVLTFPTGFDVTSVAAVSTTTSFRNRDINGGFPGTVTIGSVTANAAARTITIVTAGAATGAGAQVEFDLSGIVNSLLPSGSGYVVDIKTKDIPANNSLILQTMVAAPFYLGQTGSETITVNVFADDGSGEGGVAEDNIKNGEEEGIEGVYVMMFSPALGETSGVTDADGEVIFENLMAGSYMIELDRKSIPIEYIYNGFQQPVQTGTTKNFGLGVPSYTISGTITGLGLAGTEVDIFAGSSTVGFSANTLTIGEGGTVEYVLPAMADTDYDIGVGPALPRDCFSCMPTFTFMPPPHQTVHVGSSNIENIDFTLTSASKTITGTVRDASGNPVNGAMLFARPVASATGGTDNAFGTGGQTNTSGEFSLNVTPGTYAVSVSKPGMPPSPEKTIVVPEVGANTPATLNFVLSISANLTISGLISNSDGDSIPYAGVSAFKVNSAVDTSFVGGGNQNVVNSPADANGNYILYVNAGTWVVEAYAPGYGRLGRKTIVVTTSSVSGQDFSAQTLELGIITGQASKAGEPQRGVLVRANGVNGGNMAVTDDSGNYSLNLPAGTYTLFCYFPGLGDSTPIEDVEVESGETIADQDCALAEPITITVKITDGDPVTGAFVDARDQNGRGFGTGSYYIDESDAVYVLTLPTLVGENTYTIRANHPYYGPIGETTDIIEDTEITYTVGQRYTVGGTVESDEVLISGAWVALDGMPTGQNTPIHIGVQSDANGEFNLEAPNGVYTVRADKPGYVSSNPEIITVSGDAVEVGIIELSEASQTITGNVYLDAEGVADAFVDAYTEEGGFTVTRTSLDGSYTLSVNDGTWILRAHSMGYEAGPLEVEVSGDSPSGQDLDLEALPGFTMYGQRSENITPTNGGILTDDNIGGNFRLNIPANALGTSSDAGMVRTQQNPSLPRPPNLTVLNRNGVSISATDSLGQPIKSLNGSVTIVVPYDDEGLTLEEEQALVLGVWNEVTGTYDPLPTTVDTDANTLTAITTHFSDFAPILPTAPEAPATPTGLAESEVDRTTLTLSWNAVAGATGYDIYWSTEAPGRLAFPRYGSEPTTTGTSIGIEGLTEDTAYYFAVSAINAAGESAVSGELCVTTLALSAPLAPTDLVATSVSQTAMTIGWTASDEATSYKLYRATSLGGEYSLIASPETTSQSVSGLNASTTYYYKVKATNAAGDSDFSLVLSVTTTSSGGSTGGSSGYTPPTIVSLTLSSPNGGSSYVAGTSTNITWTSSGSTISYIRITLSSDSGLSFGTTIASNELNDGTYAWNIPSTLSAGNNYRIKLDGLNTAGTVLISDMSDTNFIIAAAGTVLPTTQTTPAAQTPGARQAPAPTPITTPVTTPGINLPGAIVLQNGDRIMAEGSSTIYLYTADGKRHAFYNEQQYKTWFADFNGVKVVPVDQLAAIGLGKNMRVHSGTYLIKITTDPKVYAVEPGGIIRWIQTEEVANALYGSGWNRKVIDIDVALFMDYYEGNPISTKAYPTGALISDQTGTYYIDTGLRRKFLNTGAFSGMNYQNAFINRVSDATIKPLVSELGTEIAVASAIYGYDGLELKP